MAHVASRFFFLITSGKTVSLRILMAGRCPAQN